MVLIVFSSTAIAQADTTKNSATTHKSSKDEPYEHAMGLGAGLDYGGLGINLQVFPHKNFGILGGGGYALAGLGWNAGIKARVTPGKYKVIPYVIAMYGYNTAIVVANGGAKELFYGFSVGIGIDIPLKKSNYPCISIGLTVPFRHAAVDDYINYLKSHGVKFEHRLLPVTFSLGIRF